MTSENDAGRHTLSQPVAERAMTMHTASQGAASATRRRRAANAVRFPAVINVAAPQEIADALERVRLSFAALGYTDSDIVRLALYEWLTARGALQPKNGHQQEQAHGDR